MRVIDVSAQMTDATGKSGKVSGSVSYDANGNAIKVYCESSSFGYDPKIKKVLKDMADKVMLGMA